ncbi:MAG: acyl--CoA ligase [Candidatus Tectomicrobia bacterium]|nr:acyl--CoA ligase [Candidatus Tectomicrobia bacterium]
MELRDVENLTVAQAVELSARRLPEKVALIAGERRVTYRDLLGMADAVAVGLAERGVKKGDRVAVALLNTPEMVASYLGCVKAGAVIVWTNPAFRHSDLLFVLRNTQPTTMFLPREVAGFDFLGMVRELRRQVPSLRQLIVDGLPAPQGPREEDLAAILERHQGATPPAVTMDVRKDVLFLQHTSGTTGVPKAAVHTNYHMVRNVVGVVNSYHGTENEVYIGHLPFFHLFGRTCTLNAALFSGASCVLQQSFQPAEALHLMAEHGVTVQHVAPAHLILELNVPDFAAHDLSSLRTGFVAGAVPPAETFKRACDRMGCHYLGSWGCSEAFEGLVCDYDHDSLEMRATTAGKPLEGFEFKVIDEAGTTLPPGQPGELCVRSYAVLTEYWRNPEETARQLDAEGWLHTGDVAVADEEEHYRIAGRLKEMVNRGGMKIYPSELESLLDKHPKVKEVCVVSTPNPVLGESICACIVPKGEEKPTLAELRQYLAEHVARYKLPDELCLFTEFPRLSGGVKLRKFGPGSIQDQAIKNEARERVR